MLELQNIGKTFEGRTVLADVNLTVPKGATHALIGSSGSGKTTLLRITLGLIPFDRGYVKINDQALLSLTHVEWADRIGYVPQDGGLFPHISGKNNVTLIATLRGWPKSRIEARVESFTEVPPPRSREQSAPGTTTSANATVWPDVLAHNHDVIVAAMTDDEQNVIAATHRPARPAWCCTRFTCLLRSGRLRLAKSRSPAART